MSRYETDAFRVIPPFDRDNGEYLVRAKDTGAVIAVLRQARGGPTYRRWRVRMHGAPRSAPWVHCSTMLEAGRYAYDNRLA